MKLLSSILKTRMNHLEQSYHNGLCLEEAVGTWQDLSLLQRIELIKMSDNDDLKILMNIYSIYFQYKTSI